jgi:hypothetical protein
MKKKTYSRKADCRSASKEIISLWRNKKIGCCVYWTSHWTVSWDSQIQSFHIY